VVLPGDDPDGDGGRRRAGRAPRSDDVAAVLAITARCCRRRRDEPAAAVIAALAAAVPAGERARLRALPRDTGAALSAWADALEVAHLRASAIAAAG
jgi:hypothetical protein